MHRSCVPAARRLALTTALLLSAHAGSQPAPAADQPQTDPPALQPPAIEPRDHTSDAAAPGPAADPATPAMDCYQAALRLIQARRLGHMTGTARPGQDAYVCDLAVQMARDGGSAAAIAAALANRAMVLAGEGRLEPALEDLEAAVAQTPDDPRLHGNRGNLLLRLDRPAEALAAHQQAVSLAPGEPDGYYNRAFSYRALGESGRAAEDVAHTRELLARRPAAPFRGSDTPAPAADSAR